MRSLTSILALVALVLPGLLVSNVTGQVNNKLSDAEVVGAGFFLQDDESAQRSVDENYQKLDLRLRELENDFATSKAQEIADDAKKVISDLKERVKELESTVEKNGESIGKNKDNFNGFLRVGHGADRKMTFFGRIHMDYWAFPKADPAIETFEGENPQDRFNFRRLRIGVKGDLTNNIFYKYEGEFAGGRNPSYRDAFIGVNELPFLNTLIIGNHKRPYGLDHLNSSRTNVFIERPFIIEAHNQDARRLGVSSNGRTENANWRFGVWNQQLTQEIGGYIGDHYQLEVAGRIAGTPWYDDSSGGRGYLHLAVSGSVGFPDGNGPNNQARYRTRPEARSTASLARYRYNRWC